MGRSRHAHASVGPLPASSARWSRVVRRSSLQHALPTGRARGESPRPVLRAGSLNAPAGRTPSAAKGAPPSAPQPKLGRPLGPLHEFGNGRLGRSAIYRTCLGMPQMARPAGLARGALWFHGFAGGRMRPMTSLSTRALLLGSSALLFAAVAGCSPNHPTTEPRAARDRWSTPRAWTCRRPAAWAALGSAGGAPLRTNRLASAVPTS